MPGTSPNASAVNAEMPTANNSTPPSSRTSSIRGRLPVGSVCTKRTPAQATNRPNRQPAAASSTLSARIWRACRMRPAPSAARIAISARRLDNRASTRFATFAQTMSNRNPTAAEIISSAGRTVVTSCSCADTTRAPHPALLSGNVDARRLATRVISRCACARPTPSANRPMTLSDRAFLERPCASFGSKARGVQTSIDPPGGKSNAAGMMPTIVYGWASS